MIFDLLKKEKRVHLLLIGCLVLSQTGIITITENSLILQDLVINRNNQRNNSNFQEFYKIERLMGSHDITTIKEEEYLNNNRNGHLKILSTPTELWSFAAGTGFSIASSAALGDINNDGKLDVIIGSEDSNVYALNGENGTLLWSFSTTPGGGVFSSPTLGDLDNDGTLEVVIGSGDSKIYALNGTDGTLLWNYTTGNNIVSSASLGDIDNDGKLEVVIGSDDNKLYALNGEDGSLLWSYQTSDRIRSSAALGDIDNDSKLEVVFGGRDNKIYALNGEDGTLLWNYSTPSRVESSAALGDIDNDGKLEVIIGGSYVYALNGEDGTLLWEQTYGLFRSSPALGDIDNDEKLEVIIGDSSSSSSKVYALNGEDGSILWEYTDYDVSWYSSAALGDINNDGKLEVLIGSMVVTGGPNSELHALNGENGTLIWQFVTGGDVESSAALGDIDNDSKLEVVIGSHDSKVYAIDIETAGNRVYWEGHGGTTSFSRTRNLNVVDNDLDFLSDYTEKILGTDPTNPDTDNDGLSDGYEVAHGLNPLIPEPKIQVNEINYNSQGEEGPEDEYIELFVVVGAIDPSYWYVTDWDTNNHWMIPDSCPVVSTGEFIVIHLGSGTNDNIGPVYHYYMSETSPQLSNLGEPLTLFEDTDAVHNRSSDVAHDFVAYGTFTEDELTGADPWCGWPNDGDSPLDFIDIGVNYESLQLIGEDINSRTNWHSANPTPSEPNKLIHSYSEDFTSQYYLDDNNTSAIGWGNGRIELSRKISSISTKYAWDVYVSGNYAYEAANVEGLERELCLCG